MIKYFFDTFDVAGFDLVSKLLFCNRDFGYSSKGIMWFLATKVIVNKDTSLGFAKFCQNSTKKIIKNIAFQVHKLATTLQNEKRAVVFQIQNIWTP